MGITYLKEIKTFKLDTKNSTYMIAIVDEEQFIGHIYYGKRIEDEEMLYLLRIYEPPYVPTKNDRDRCSFYDTFPTEYATHGIGDYRDSALKLRSEEGHTAGRLQYVSHDITNGKAVPITWKKSESTKKMHYYDESGNILTINPGKNLHCYIPNRSSN